MQPIKVIAEITEIEGGQICTFGHKVGEKFVFKPNKFDNKLCAVAVKSLLPAVNALLKGKKFPWYVEGQDFYWGCQHPGSTYKGLGRMIFKLTLVKK